MITADQFWNKTDSRNEVSPKTSELFKEVFPKLPAECSLYFVDTHSFHRVNGTIGSVTTYRFGSNDVNGVLDEMTQLTVGKREVYVYEIGEVNMPGATYPTIRLEAR